MVQKIGKNYIPPIRKLYLNNVLCRFMMDLRNTVAADSRNKEIL